VSDPGRKDIVGYSNHLSVAPGDRLEVKVSTYGPQSYRADIVRLVCGDDTPGGAGFAEEEIGSEVDGDYDGRHQPIHTGSSVYVPPSEHFAGLAVLTVVATIWPTRPGSGEQAILGTWSEQERTGFALLLDSSGALALRLGDGAAIEQHSSGTPLQARRWHRVAATFDADRHVVRIQHRRLATRADLEKPASRVEVEATTALAGLGPSATRSLSMAAWTSEEDDDRRISGAHFDGKIENPRLTTERLSADEIDRLSSCEPEAFSQEVVGAWDFSHDISGDEIRDRSRHGHHGTALQLPTRAVTGSNWDGSEHDWRHAPEQYGAIHFHSDDLYDAEWETDFTYQIPDALRSGLYAARLRTATGEDHVPFFVRPPRGSSTAKLAFLAPTATYMAYANSRLHFQAPGMEIMNGRLTLVTDNAWFLLEHPEVGLSLYDHHADGSGVCYSSRLRPILDMRPRTRLWSLNSDTHILAWLETAGFAYDVITDEDLHQEGPELLEPYRVVMTGTHPEYYSAAMLDGLHSFVSSGGRLMYMGGNGFYWNTVFDPNRPGVIEVRRTEDGTRAWKAEPGEYHHSFTGEYGGLWLRKGRPPNLLVGIGFAAQGFDTSSHYRRRSESHDPRAAFIFEGIEEDIIGDFGVIGDGAAGEEIDRFDTRLGSPPHALVLATSEDHSSTYMLTKEELFSNIPGTSGLESPLVRADLVFFETAGGGAVFSTGSIAWSASLPHNDWDNNVATLSGNVLRRFLDPTPFEIP